MKTFIAGLIAGPALFATTLASAGEFSGNITLATDYAFRGISQTFEDPALQGGFDYAHENGFYAGVWASTVDFGEASDPGNNTNLEIDLYTGFNGEINDIFGWTAGVLYYAYPEQPNGAQFDFWEINAGWTAEFDGPSLAGTISYSPDYFAASDSAIYSNIAMDVPVWDNVNLGLSLGYQVIDDNATFGTPDYWDWGVSVGFGIVGFDVTLAYVDTDLSTAECFGGTGLCDDRAILSVGRSL